MIEKRVETNESLETRRVIITSRPVLPDENHPGCIIEEYAHAKIDLSRASRTFPRRPRCRASMKRRTASCRSCRIKHSQRSAGGTPPMTNALTVSYSSPSPTFPRKFADVDWGSRKINRNKICAECWPGAAFGPYWLLTERLRYETTPLLPALRDRVHVHGQLRDAYASHHGGHPASGNREAAGAGRKQHTLTNQLPT